MHHMSMYAIMLCTKINELKFVRVHTTMYMFTCVHVHVHCILYIDYVYLFATRLEAVEEKLKDSELSAQKQLNESKNKLEVAVVSVYRRWVW